MQRNQVLLWSVLLSTVLSLSLVGCKKSNKNSSENSNESSSEPSSEKPADGPRRELPELSEQAKEWEKKKERVRNGETVDFWGDGSKYRAWFDEEGVRHVEIRTPDDKISSTFKTWPDGSRISTTYADGIIRRQIEKTPGKEVQLYDRNLAGFFNERLTQEAIPGSMMIHRTLERRTSATKDWTIIEKGDVPAGHSGLLHMPEEIQDLVRKQTKGSKKNSHERSHASSALPKAANAQSLTEESPANEVPEWHIGYDVYVWFTSDGEPFDGRTQCSYDDVGAIQMALDFVMGDGMNCLRQANPTEAELLQQAMENGQKVMISCGLEDYPQYFKHDAITVENTQEPFDMSHVILFNKSRLPSEETLREALFHELLHVSGFPFDPKNHDNGTDELYACARYCAASAEAKATTNHPIQVDCERCGRSSKPECKIDCDKLEQHKLPGVVLNYWARGAECDILMSCAGSFDHLSIGKGVEATLTQGEHSLWISQGTEHASCIVSHNEMAQISSLEIIDSSGVKGRVQANVSTESLVYAQLNEDAKLHLELKGEDLRFDASSNAELRGEVHLTGLLLLVAYSPGMTATLQGSANALVLGAYGGYYDFADLDANKVEVIVADGAHAIVRANESMKVSVMSGASVDYNRPAECSYMDVDALQAGDCP